MGVQERDTQIYLQWKGLYTTPVSGKNQQNTRTDSQHQEVQNENTNKNPGKTCRQPSARIFWHPRRDRALLTSTCCAVGHQPVVDHHTQPHTMSKRLGCNHKEHEKTPYSGPQAGEKLPN